MATCQNKLVKAYTDSKNRAKDLSKIMKVTAEGEVLSETINIANKALKLLKEGVKDLSSVNRQRLIANDEVEILREELTDVFQAAVESDADSNSERKEYVLKGASLDNGLLTVTSSLLGSNEESAFVFDFDSNVSRLSDDGTRMFIPALVNVTNRIRDNFKENNAKITKKQAAIDTQEELSNLQTLINNTDDINKLLGSVEGSVNAFNYNKASKRKNYVHSSIEDMRNVLLDLHATTTNPASKELLEYYESLLDKMHPHFFRNMNLYINENADHTGGWVDIDKNNILLNKSDTLDKGMTNEEAYMHEVIHTMTTWAFDIMGDKASDLRVKFNSLRNRAFKKIKWQDIYKADANLTEDAAKKRYDYIFNVEKNPNADEEFLAYALTNPAFMKLLDNVSFKEGKQEGLLNIIKDFFKTLVDIAMGNYTFKNRNTNVKTEIHALAYKLAEINNKAEEDMKSNPLLQLNNMIDSAEYVIEKFAHHIPKLLDTDGKVVIPENMNPAQYVAFIAKGLTKGIYNNNYRDVLGHMFSSYGIAANGSLREIIRSVLPTIDESNNAVEFLGMQTNTIDMFRNGHVGIVANSIADGFSKTLSNEEQESLTGILLESNGSVLFDKQKNLGKGYSDFQLVKLFNDQVYRQKARKRLKTIITKKYSKRADWIIGQAEGLGYMMSMGTGHSGQNTNSANIVRGFMSDEHYPMDDKLLHLVEELVSLTAISFAKADERQLAAELLKKEADGVRNVVHIYESFKKQSADVLFANDKVHLMEGYIKELFDDTIDVITEPLVKQAELEQQGYHLISVVDHPDLAKGQDIGVFVSDVNVKAERLRGAVIMGNPHSRGLTLKSIRYKQFEDSKKHAQVWFESDKLRMADKVKEINEKLEEGVVGHTIEKGPVPILNRSGNPVDYRIMMEKPFKEKYLKQRRGIVEVLSKTSGTLVDKVAREEQNNRVLKHIKKDIKEVYDNPSSERNLKEYTPISAESSDPEIRKLFYMLPESYQAYAEARKDKSLQIPSILLNPYFGYEHYKTTDLPGVKQLPSVIKKVLNIAEAVWMDMIKIVKGNILLKMPVILASNIISNIFYAFNTGTKISEIFKMYVESFREVGAYMKAHKAFEQKKVELAILGRKAHTTFFSQNALDEHNEKIERLNIEIKQLQKDMDNSNVKELFDLGMYQAVIEDVNMYKLGDTNRISNGMDKLLSKMPGFIKTPAQVLYLSKETAWYKINQDFLQLSDLVARDVMNRKQKKIEQEQADGKRKLPLFYLEKMSKDHPEKKELKGVTREKFLEMAKEHRHKYILDSFVNYVLPNGKGEEYLNRLGLLMFTKYFKRIQKVIGSASTKHPIRSVLTLLGTSLLLNPDIIQEQSFFYKAFDDNDNGIGGVIPWYSPLHNILTFLNPPLVNLVRNPLN